MDSNGKIREPLIYQWSSPRFFDPDGTSVTIKLSGLESLNSTTVEILLNSTFMLTYNKTKFAKSDIGRRRLFAQLMDLEGVWYNYTLDLQVSFLNESMLNLPSPLPSQNITKTETKNASVGQVPPILEPSLPSPPQVTFPTRVNATVDYSAKPPTVSLSKVSQNGEVKIMFSEEMLIPENVDFKNVLSLSVISAIDDWREGTLTKSRRLGDQPEFRWSITEHTNTYISLLLDFDHAVSSTNYGYDNLQVEIKDPSVFLSRVSNLPVEIPANGVIGKSIPSQI